MRQRGGQYRDDRSWRKRRRFAVWLCLAACTAVAGCAPQVEYRAPPWQAGQQAQPPGPLIRSINYSFTPDARFVWHGPRAAAGVYVWAHGKGRRNTDDLRGVEPPPHVRWLNDAGYDVVRFDRAPMVDERNRAAGWLRDGLAWLRRAGYARVVTGGQSRGAWNSLQILDTPGLADAVVAISPAAHGSGASLNLLGQTDDFRQLLADAAPQRTRVVFVQFSGDGFIGDPDARVRLLSSILRPKIPALLVIDRPEGFAGHGAGYTRAFAQRYGACILDFVTAEGAAVPASC